MHFLDILRFPSGSVIVLTRDGAWLGPYQNDDDAQWILQELRKEGVEAVALECLGNN